MQVVFRVDASPTLGTGHVMRCVALAQALGQSGAQSLFIAHQLGPAFERLITDNGFALKTLSTHASPEPGLAEAGAPWSVDTDADAKATIAVIRSGTRPDWLVVDHYGLDARWEAMLRPHAERLLAIDDLANRPHAVQALLDQNLQRSAARYDPWLPPRCRRLLGPRFALLRPGFSEACDETPADQTDAASPRLLACFGGTDPKDILSRLLETWESLPAPRPALDIAVGRATPNLAKLQSACADLPGVSLHVQTADMPGLMRRSSLMLCTTGTISWERCALGVPAVMGTTADNQHDNMVLLARARTGVSVGAWEDVPPDHLRQILLRLLSRPGMLQRMGARARALVDGQGALRAAAYMHGPHVSLRRAKAADAKAALTWRNAPATRRWFFNSDPVRAEAHMAWWEATLADPKRQLLVASAGLNDIGIVRLDHRGQDEAVMSIYLNPAFVGLGLGASVIKATLAWCTAAERRIRTLIAEILPDNRASIAAFESAGFRRERDHWIARSS